MGIKTRINNAPAKQNSNLLSEKLYREERNYRADRLVEKWSNVAEIGRGITDMPTNTARNLAILLENQTRAMSRMTEAQMSSNFFGYTPENVLRLVRLSYPNSIRGQLFTEFAMESAHDSIKYIMPVYTKAKRNDFDYDLNQGTYSMDNRFDDVSNNADIMYESIESRYATELVNATVSGSGSTFTVEFKGGAFGENGENYIDGYTTVSLVIGDRQYPIAMQRGSAFSGVDHEVSPNYLVLPSLKIGDKEITGITVTPSTATASGATYNKLTISATVPSGVTVTKAICVGRYDSEVDLTGKYLGEVELQMKDYHFRPRPITLGVTWTQLTELVLDTSFGVSAEEMLMDSAAQEIKKTLDFQAVKYAYAMQAVGAKDNVAYFDAEAGDNTDDSYFHTAQLIEQSIDRIGDIMLNKINRGGVSAIVGGPAAINYLKLNKAWSDRGAQPKIGGHKVGELNGVPCFKVPSSIIPDSTLLTTWKNPQNESDVSVAIGTLMPFYSTGTLQRVPLYKEAAVARFEDTQCLQPEYLGRIEIKNIRSTLAG